MRNVIISFTDCFFVPLGPFSAHLLLSLEIKHIFALFHVNTLDKVKEWDVTYW